MAAAEDLTIVIGITKLDWDQADIDAVIEAFRYRTGVDLRDSRHKPADAWATYKANQRAWINRAHARRKLLNGSQHGRSE